MIPCVEYKILLTTKHKTLRVKIIMKSQFLLFGKRRFLPLFVTQFATAFNDSLFKSFLSILITYGLVEQGKGDYLITVGAGLFILPFILFSHIAGQLADKYEKSLLIRYLKIAELAIGILGSLSLFTNNIYLLFAALFLFGTQSSFFGPLKYSILPASLKNEELIAGNGLIESGTFISILLGTIIGGVIDLDSLGKVIISSIIICSSIIGLVSSYFIPVSLAAAPELQVNFSASVIKTELKFIKETNRSVFLSILGISWFWMIGSMLITEMPVYVKTLLSSDAKVSTFLFSLFSLGIAIGTMLCNKLMKGKVNANYIPIVAMGMSIFIFDLSGISFPQHSSLYNLEQFFSFFSAWRIIFDLFALAICGGLYIVPLYVILQSNEDYSSCSRVIAMNNLVNTLFIFIYSIVLALLMERGVAINNLFLLTAILNGLVALYMCKLLPEVTIKFLLRQMLKLFYRVEVFNIDNFTSVNERALIIANHTSFLDAVLIASFLPGKVTFAVNTYVAKKLWIRPFLSLVDFVALDPTNPMAIKQFIKELENDKKCVIFPEGRITVTGSMMKIYEGTAVIADKTRSKIIPIQIEGAQYTPFSKLTGKVKIKLFPKITINILPAEHINVPNDIVGKERRAKLALKMYDLMSNMSFTSSTNHNKTLFNALIEARNLNGAAHVIAEDVNREAISYNDLITKILILGRCLFRVIKSEEYIGILLPNMVSSIVTFFAIQAYAKVPAMLNYSSGVANIISACETVKLKYIISSRLFIEKGNLQTLADAIKSKGYEIIYLEDLKDKISLSDKCIGFIASLFPYIYYKFVNSLQAINPEKPCVVLFTSGSEGVPKGVVLSHKNIQTNRAQLASRIDFGPSDIVFNALPIFHSFGLTAATLLPMLSGIKVFFYPSPLHYRVIPELVYDTDSTIMFGTSTFLQNYAKYAHPYDFYSIRYIFSGAEKLKEEVYKLWLDKFGVKIFEGYGATETSPIISTNTAMHNKFGSVGRIMPGIKAILEEVPGVTEGKKLLVEGGNIMLGYMLHNNPKVITPPKEGVYDTGDIVYLDDEDYIYIKGRAKRFAKIAGEMVSLTAVEGLISLLWPNFSHAVIAIPDEKKGEQLVLVTTYKDARREEISKHSKSLNASELSVPKKIMIVSQLPLLGTGKTDYVSLQQQVLGLKD